VNDFETVRAAVERDEPRSLPRRDEDARAALDRIEAEVTSLRDQYAKDGAEVDDLKAKLWNRTHERDGLRAACDVATAEVERLRAALNDMRRVIRNSSTAPNVLDTLDFIVRNALAGEKE
jgi:chromosome segregation ATPase